MTTTQEHAEALEKALALLPASLNQLGIHDIATWNAYVRAANPDAIRALLDERKKLREALAALTSAFMAHTRWNGDPPCEVNNARDAIANTEDA